MGLLAKLPPELQSRATELAYERQAYAHDMSPFDGMITSDWLKALPDLVVMPRNTAEVSALLKWAYEARVSVTPRAAGSSSLFQSVPAKGGVLLDLNMLNGTADWDLDDSGVTVGAGKVIYDLFQEAEERGLSLQSFPSSAPVGTFGGWYNNGGLGYGSLQHGPLSAQVRELEVVLANGAIHRLTGETIPSKEWLLGSEGTLGIVTKLRLALDRAPEAQAHQGFSFPNIADLEAFVLAMMEGPFLPSNLVFVAATLGGRPIQKINWDMLMPGTFLVADYFGQADQVEQGIGQVRRLKSGFKVQQLPRWQAEKFWDDRFYNFRLQRTGPSLLGAEVVLPLHKVGAYVRGIDHLAKSMKKPMITFGYASSRSHAYVTTMFWANEARTAQYLLDISLVNSIYITAFSHGARPAGVGLWNTPYLKYAYTRKELHTLRQRKRLLDPRGILNPGKKYRAAKMLNPAFFTGSMLALRGIRKIVNGIRSVDA